MLSQNNISFKARVFMNTAEIKKDCQSDKFFQNAQYSKNLDEVMSQVDSLSLMKENSVVRISPRLDNNKLNLICRVSDDLSMVETVVKERSARNIAKESSFAERFVRNIANAIKNVDKTKESVLEVNDFINNSKTLQDDGFMSNLPKNILHSFENNVNPTKRIISVLERIEKEYPNEVNSISIKNIKNNFEIGKQSRINTYFCIQNSKIDKKTPMHLIMKDPMDNLFV